MSASIRNCDNVSLWPVIPVSQAIASINGVGWKGALFIQQVHYWLRRSERFEYDDEGTLRPWIHNTQKQWQQQLHIGNDRTVGNVIKRLRDTGILLTRRLSASQWKQTLWFSLDLERLDDLVYEKLGHSQLTPNSEEKKPTSQDVGFRPSETPKIDASRNGKFCHLSYIDYTKNTSERGTPSLTDVILIAEEEGIAKSDAEHFYHHYNKLKYSQGWGRIANIYSALIAWVKKGQQFERNGSEVKPEGPRYNWGERIDEI